MYRSRRRSAVTGAERVIELAAKMGLPRASVPNLRPQQRREVSSAESRMVPCRLRLGIVFPMALIVEEEECLVPLLVDARDVHRASEATPN